MHHYQLSLNHIINLTMTHKIRLEQLQFKLHPVLLTSVKTNFDKKKYIAMPIAHSFRFYFRHKKNYINVYIVYSKHEQDKLKKKNKH